MPNSILAPRRKPRGLDALPVKKGLVIAFIVAVALYLLFFLWFSLASAYAEEISHWPEAIANIVLYTRWNVVVSWIFGLVFAAGFLLLTYLLIMIFYLFTKRRFPTKRYVIEIVFIVIAFAFSCIMKTVVLWQAQPKAGLEQVLLSIFSAFYATLGGLSFEGLPFEEVGGVALISCYYGSSVVAGLSFIGIIASGAAYEFYSFLLFRFLKTKGKDLYVFTDLNDETIDLANSIVDGDDREKADNAIVVFSGPALDAFDRHDKRCLEVMAHGYIYWSVSEKERYALLDRVFYRSLAWRFAKEKCKAGKEARRPASASLSDFGSVNVFAFDADDDHAPNEEENLNYVFENIDDRLALMEKVTARRNGLFVEYLQNEDALIAAKDQEERDALISRQAQITLEAEKEYSELCRNNGLSGDLENVKDFEKLSAIRRETNLENGLELTQAAYYILTKRRIDYPAYQNQIAPLEQRFQRLLCSSDLICFHAYSKMREAQRKIALAKGEDREEASRQYEALCRCYERLWTMVKPFAFRVWNEADCVAEQVSIALHADPLHPYVPRKDYTWMVSVGFGVNGQAIAKAVYASSAMVDEKGVAAKFRCDVYDPAGIEKVAGLWSVEVPYSVSLCEGRHEDPVLMAYEKKRGEIFDRLQKERENPNAPAWADKVSLSEQLNREMALPLFYFHQGGFGSAGTEEVLSIDPFAMREDKKKTIHFPDFITVATGDDYSSIRIGNALAGLIHMHRPDHPVSIFINIWDEKNNALVEGFNKAHTCEKDISSFEYAPNIRIVITGNNEDVYRYSHIADEDDAVVYHDVYSQVASSQQMRRMDSFGPQASAYFAGKGEKVDVPSTYGSLLELIGKRLGEFGTQERSFALARWRATALWKRVSSSAACRYGPTYALLMEGKQDHVEGNYLADLARIEHQRWMRVHIADGWTYAKERNDLFREHPCLLPAAYVPADTLCYDLMNVLVGAKAERH